MARIVLAAVALASAHGGASIRAETDHRLSADERVWLRTEGSEAQPDWDRGKIYEALRANITVSKNKTQPEGILGKSCAAVSNSGAMTSHEHGRDIDSHDFVMRFNTAPTKGFEQFVGSRESIRVGWHLPMIKASANFCQRISTSGGCDSKETMYVEMSGGYELPKQCEPFKACGRVRPLELGVNFGDHVQFLHKLYPDLLGSSVHKVGTTTGFHHVVWLLSRCKYVDLYEFAPSEAAMNAAYHYYPETGLSVSRFRHGNETVPTEEDLSDVANLDSHAVADLLTRPRTLHHSVPMPPVWEHLFAEHGLAKAEHDFWQRISVTPEQEIRRTGKARIMGLFS